MTHPVENTAPSTGTAGDPVAAILRPLLARQLGRLRRRYLLHGLAKALLLTAALVALFFVLDRWLRLGVDVDWARVAWGNDGHPVTYPANLTLLVDTLDRHGAGGLLHRLLRPSAGW